MKQLSQTILLLMLTASQLVGSGIGCATIAGSGNSGCSSIAATDTSCCCGTSCGENVDAPVCMCGTEEVPETPAAPVRSDKDDERLIGSSVIPGGASNIASTPGRLLSDQRSIGTRFAGVSLQTSLCLWQT